MRTYPLILILVIAAAPLRRSRQELTSRRRSTPPWPTTPRSGRDGNVPRRPKRLEGGKSHRLPEDRPQRKLRLHQQPRGGLCPHPQPGLRFDMEGFFLSDPNNPDPLSTFITSIDLELPIYTGGKLSARNRTGRIDGHRGGAFPGAHPREGRLRDDHRVYVNLAKAREHRALLEKARATTAEHVRIAEQYAAQGVILEADVLAGEGLPVRDGRPPDPGCERRQPRAGRPQLPNGRGPGSATRADAAAPGEPGRRKPRQAGFRPPSRTDRISRRHGSSSKPAGSRKRPLRPGYLPRDCRARPLRPLRRHDLSAPTATRDR